jgi:glycosyltransferase involved in cell wall biosynthesis
MRTFLLSRQSGTRVSEFRLFEAMAAGTPAVGRRFGGVAETVQDARTGFLVEKKHRRGLAEAILNLLRMTRSWSKLAGTLDRDSKRVHLQRVPTVCSICTMTCVIVVRK